jgi:large subunit ribosomal protein L10
MPTAEKAEKVAALKERIEGSNALLLAEYRGLTVQDATELRRSLADAARLAVTKNTLLRRAAGEAGIEGLDELLAGPTAVAFVEGDVVAAAKKIVDAAKKYPALVLKGGYMDGRVLSAAEAQALATLESREVMLSKIAGMLKSEMSRAASMFQAMQSRFVGLMEALRDKLPPEPAAEAVTAAEPSEAEAPTEAVTVVEPAEAEAEAEAVEEAAPEAVDGGSSLEETASSTTDTGDDSPGDVAGADDPPTPADDTESSEPNTEEE